MYLHIGKNVVVTHKSILAVFDLDNSSQSYLTREYLYRLEKLGRVINVSEDIPKAFVVCIEEDGSQTAYLSQLASSTLLKRSESISFE